MATVLLITMMFTAFYVQAAKKEITVNIIDGESFITVQTTNDKVRDILEEAEINTTKYDYVEPNRDFVFESTVGTITIERAKPYCINVDGELITVFNVKSDSVEIVSAAGIVLGANDRVEFTGAKLNIVRGEIRDEITTQPIDFSKVEEKSSSIAAGKSQIKVDGKEGLRTLTYKVKYENGTEISRELVDNVVTIEPVNKVVLVGTKVAVIPKASKINISQPNSVAVGQVSNVAPMNYTEEELNLLARLIYCEASKTNEEDMLLVGNVVLNRVASSRWANSIKGVIYQSGQYSTVRSGAINNTPGAKQIAAARRLLNGERFCPPNVVFQAAFVQGNGVWKKVGIHLFCYQ